MPLSIPVVLRTRTPEHPTLTVLGVVPDPACPLAVTPAQMFDHTTQQWRPHSVGGFCITHRPTGYTLGNHRFASQQDALDTIDRLDWRFAAWPAATGAAGDPAMLACRVKWKQAMSAL